MSRIALISVCTGVLLFGTLFSIAGISQEQLSVYRDQIGEMSKESEKNARAMIRRAERDGSIRVWITLDGPLETNPNRLTADVKTAQEEDITRRLDEIIQPLISRGDAWFPLGIDHRVGPGCLIEVNASGIETLIRSQDLAQISSL